MADPNSSSLSSSSSSSSSSLSNESQILNTFRPQSPPFHFEDICLHFDKPLESAARSLSISPSQLKKIARRVGVRRWPYRQLSKITTLSTPSIPTMKTPSINTTTTKTTSENFIEANTPNITTQTNPSTPSPNHNIQPLHSTGTALDSNTAASKETQNAVQAKLDEQRVEIVQAALDFHLSPEQRHHLIHALRSDRQTRIQRANTNMNSSRNPQTPEEQQLNTQNSQNNLRRSPTTLPYSQDDVQPLQKISIDSLLCNTEEENNTKHSN